MSENDVVFRDADVIVIGGGAAGMFAACRLSEAGKKVMIVEPNRKLGRKLRITGKGRCNLTNNSSSENVMKHIMRNQKFMFSALAGFSPDDVMSWFESKGVPLKTERGNRVFPKSDRADDVADALADELKRRRVSVVRDKALHIIVSDGAACGVECEKAKYYAGSVLLATGGMSYPATGSTGDGYRMAREVGHSISDLRPSLVPVMIRERFAAELSGLTLKNVTLSVFEEGRKKPVYSELGEVSFAAYGIAGPLTLSASCVMDTDKLEGGKYTAVIDLKPALDREQLDRRLLRDFESAHGDSFEKELTRLLPVQMIPVFANLTGIDHATSCSRLTRQDRAKILELLKCFKLTPYALRPIEEAIITRGGVSVKEINPVTMESKLVKGLYFSGEIIDVDATTGGYNLQIAFSTANSAAAAIAGKTKKGECATMVINCAIDGPSGAGKSTIAKGVAKRLGLVYVDTGALYRTVGLYALRCGADTTSADEVMPLLDGMSVELKYVNGEQRVLLNGEDVSDVIRTNEISMAASNVSAIPAVREFLLGLQRNIAASTSIVMDGRDIGTVILPQANVKIFMTASAEERAKRRHKELVERGQSISYEEVLNDINKRDYNDSHRDIAPLKKADDAYELDTTGMTIDEVVGKVCLIIEQKTSAVGMSEQIEPAPKRRSLSKLHLFIYGVVRLGVRAYLRLICRLRYEGTENIPSSGSYIVASNHISWSDPVYVNAAVKNVSSYIAKESIFKHPLSFLLKVLHVFPIKRDQTDRDALSTAVRYLDKGYNLTIFPEGTRSKDGKLGKGKSGVAFISHAAKADILPAGITVKKEKGKRKSVTVRYGKIIPYTSLGITGMSASQLRHARDMVMSKIGELIDIE